MFTTAQWLSLFVVIYFLAYTHGRRRTSWFVVCFLGFLWLSLLAIAEDYVELCRIQIAEVTHARTFPPPPECAPELKSWWPSITGDNRESICHAYWMSIERNDCPNLTVVLGSWLEKSVSTPLVLASDHLGAALYKLLHHLDTITQLLLFVGLLVVCLFACRHQRTHTQYLPNPSTSFIGPGPLIEIITETETPRLITHTPQKLLAKTY